MNITFLGAGAFGTALGKIAEENGNQVTFYDPVKFPGKTVGETTKSADIIVYAAPSNQAAKLLPQLPKDVPLICASKGFLSEKPFKDFRDFSALGGAAFAEDFEKIKTGQDTHGRAFLKLTASSPLAEQLFSTDYLQIEYTKDTKGILLCGALKNVYAIGAGLFGTENGDDDDEEDILAMQPYLGEVIPELIDILAANGSNKFILLLSCGAEDLALSAQSDSRNFRFGRAIKAGKTPEDVTTEGLSVIKSLESIDDFTIPASATIFKDIIRIVTEAIKD